MARHPLPHPAVSDASSTDEADDRSVALNLLISLRPEQWSKNLFVFAALVFGQLLLDPIAVARVATAFFVFCALSGVVYLVNDVADREADRRHALKARRPVASGALAPRIAIAAGAGLGSLALAIAFWLDPGFGGVSAAYVTLLLAYSGALKHVVIVDVLTIAAGFVLRAIAGAVVIAVPISAWLLICTSLLALFLALSKRRHEVVMLAANAFEHRPTLGEYSPYLLDQMISVVTASTLISYAFYAISEETASKFGTTWLGLTIPFPLYGIFRYLYLVHQKEGGGSPSEILLADRPMLICVGLWVTMVVLLIYDPLGL